MIHISKRHLLMASDCIITEINRQNEQVEPHFSWTFTKGNFVTISRNSHFPLKSCWDVHYYQGPKMVGLAKRDSILVFPWSNYHYQSTMLQYRLNCEVKDLVKNMKLRICFKKKRKLKLALQTKKLLEFLDFPFWFDL